MSSINTAHPFPLHAHIKKNSFCNEIILIIVHFGEQIQEPCCNVFPALVGNPRAQKSADHLKKKYSTYIKCRYKGYALQPVICICLRFSFSPDPNLSLFAAFAIWPLKRSPVELLPQPPLTPGEQTAIMGN